MAYNKSYLQGGHQLMMMRKSQYVSRISGIRGYHLYFGIFCTFIGISGMLNWRANTEIQVFPGITIFPKKPLLHFVLLVEMKKIFVQVKDILENDLRTCWLWADLFPNGLNLNPSEHVKWSSSKWPLISMPIIVCFLRYLFNEKNCTTVRNKNSVALTRPARLAYENLKFLFLRFIENYQPWHLAKEFFSGTPKKVTHW